MDKTYTVPEPTALPNKCEILRRILAGLGQEPSGPIYKSTNKHLAKIEFDSCNDEDGIYHLSESHGATLRNTMGLHLRRKMREVGADVAFFGQLMSRNQFEGPFHGGFLGLQQRLAELPKEWTVVQLTVEWDPLERFPCRDINVNRGLGIYITRFACGNLAIKTNQLGKYEQPFATFLSAFDNGEDRLSFTAAMRKHLSKFETQRTDRRKAHEECSMEIEATVNELQTWFGGWLCLFMGRLVSEKLEHAVKTAIKSFIHVERMGEIKEDVSDKLMNILYLLASSPSILPSEVPGVVHSLVKDKKFASYVSKKVCDVKSTFNTALNQVERHPVILLIDEELDILPFEVIAPLRDQSFTRMPSIHFLHSLFHCHKNSAIQNGVNTENCYYIINPSDNLPSLDKLFETISAVPVVSNWKGVHKTVPTSHQFLSGVQDHDLFVYCGHGDGSQFLRKSIDSVQNKAVVFLFGCSSSSLTHLGGRVEMTSSSYNYLMSGSPCVVGMLWPVLDSDINAMTEELVKSWCTPEGSVQKVPDVHSLDRDFQNLNITSTESRKSSRELAKAVCMTRKMASRFLNKAAIVVRGLPVNAM